MKILMKNQIWSKQVITQSNVTNIYKVKQKNKKILYLFLIYAKGQNLNYILYKINKKITCMKSVQCTKNFSFSKFWESI